jgi:hypothetical protein
VVRWIPLQPLVVPEGNTMADDVGAHEPTPVAMKWVSAKRISVQVGF